MSHSSTDATNPRRLTIHRLLDMLMQNAWSWIACICWRRAKAKSALHSPQRGFVLISERIADCEGEKNEVWEIIESLLQEQPWMERVLAYPFF
jgi:hypothetical protein